MMIFGCIIFLFFFTSYSDGMVSSNKNLVEPLEPDIHYYFAYGSNMLYERIHISIPSAKKVGIAFLKDYTIGFAHVIPRWNSGVATLNEQKNATVYGVLYKTNEEGMKILDFQEGVHNQVYFRTAANVTLLENGERFTAFIYRVVERPKLSAFEQMPSITYLKCIVKGAQESGLPKPYIRRLKQIKHNGLIAPEIDAKLNLSTFDLDVEEDEGGEDGKI